MKKITKKSILKFRMYLINNEKSNATVEKYIRDVTKFSLWITNEEVTKIKVLEYKKKLIGEYAPKSVNSMIASINSFFNFMEWYEFKTKSLKIQKQIFAEDNKELTKDEYKRLLTVAKDKNDRLYYLMQAICSTGIRVSELKYITVNAVKTRTAVINCKGKMRIVFLPKKLCVMLEKYSKKNNIQNGAIFISKSGKPLDRSNIWLEMKKLCEIAKVPKEKVFPHNLRHLFARTYYYMQKDIVRLADILGHSSIETTRIYTMETDDIHRKQIEKMHLLHY